MAKSFLIPLSLSVALFAASQSSIAQVYKCTDGATGHVTYSQIPCPHTSKKDSVQIQTSTFGGRSEWRPSDAQSAELMRYEQRRQSAELDEVNRRVSALESENTELQSQRQTDRGPSPQCAKARSDLKREELQQRMRPMPATLQVFKNRVRDACRDEPPEPIRRSSSYSMPTPPPVPTVITSCDPGGCWDNLGNRYMKGAGTTYIPTSGGGACQQLGNMMHCH